MSAVLVAGGAGYIGSHMARALPGSIVVAAWRRETRAAGRPAPAAVSVS